jgi:hypothetical protein
MLVQVISMLAMQVMVDLVMDSWISWTGLPVKLPPYLIS